MKKLILIALIAFGGWQYYQKQTDAPVVEPVEQVFPDYSIPLQKARDTANKLQYRCDGRQHCSQMTSRAEAEFFLENCPNTKMDGDNDGIPCENDSRW
ncbi:excalibur calcium-binding domain-containing protein [Rheinheimera sp. MMS21-TC3]|uniref:excalibur calcium-binding domain-containing protein n=1 Tax=Rheinheimera sp. MMS21-TC3 TaxID=3072790 RepID=UPI0028C4F05E|nr:excalibur calcium-binding domain-containing protein [Rheinheimera sp. MMS21-TC3]WNO59693.1 excalibur calcium-binding domain-containing protein [Rheinheimera sp. MMS21-TC3]